jgi:hypothetical protein
VARLNNDPTQGLSWGTNCAIVRQAWRWHEDTIDRHDNHQTDEAEDIPTRTMTGLSHGLSGGRKSEGSFRSLLQSKKNILFQLSCLVCLT